MYFVTRREDKKNGKANGDKKERKRKEITGGKWRRRESKERRSRKWSSTRGEYVHGKKEWKRLNGERRRRVSGQRGREIRGRGTKYEEARKNGGYKNVKDRIRAGQEMKVNIKLFRISVSGTRATDTCGVCGKDKKSVLDVT